MEVTLLNPESVRSSLEEIGKFASICKADSTPPKEKCIAIGKHCIKSGHFSPTRHIKWVFQVSGISRICSHQLVRHSVGVNINQSSGVFQSTTDKNVDFVIPSSVKKYLDENVTMEGRYYSLLNEALELSEKLVEAGISNSDARYVVPQAVTTSMNIAVTPEAIMHLCNERLCSKAQWEIRSVVQKMRDAVIEQEAFYKPFLQPKCILYGRCTEAKSCGYFEHMEYVRDME